MRYDPGMRDRIFKEYYKLSKDALAKDRNIDLVVWPETMFTDPLWSFDADAARPPQFEGTDAEFHKQLRQIGEQNRTNKSVMAWTAQTLGVPLLLGVDANHFAAGGVQCFNSAAYVARDGRLLGRYDKMHLVMFGEYVPLADCFPWLQRLTPLPISVTPGRRPAAFDLDGVRLAPNICYESCPLARDPRPGQPAGRRGPRARRPGQSDQRRLVLGLQRSWTCIWSAECSARWSAASRC